MAKRIGRVKQRRALASAKLGTSQASHLRKQSTSKFLHPALSRADLAGHADYHRKGAQGMRLLSKGGHRTRPAKTHRRKR